MQITKVIKEHGLTISEVAERMGVNKSTLSTTISHGNMLVDTLRRIAQAVGCSISEFFADEEMEKNKKESASKPDFTALIDLGGEMYRADSLSQLEAIISTVEKREK